MYQVPLYAFLNLRRLAPFTGIVLSFILLLICSPILKVQAQCNEHYDWATWNSFSGNSATGTIFTGGQTIDVTMTANYTFDFTNYIYNYAAFNGFQGPLPPDATVPRTTWASGPGGETTMCFSEPVDNPALLISSLGNPGLAVTLDFSHPYSVIYDGGGMTYPNDMSVIGQEGYCILIFPGNIECVTIYSSTPEYWTNITWGLNPPLFEVILEGDTIACENTTITASGGDTYAWDGGQNPNSPSNTFTETGTYFLTVTDSDGCTVLTSISVEIFPTEETEFSEAICEGDEYYFDGQYLTVAGTYTAILQTWRECDSTIILNLDVNPLHEVEVFEEICEGDFFDFNGDQYSESGTYSVVLQNEFECDSTVHLNLTVHPLSYTEVDVEICEGETYDFDGQTLGTTGSYYAYLLNDNQCDSTVLLTLIVNPASIFEIQAGICSGEYYVFEGDTLTTDGTYFANLTNQYGCDSTVILTLETTPSSTTNLATAICAGESYDFFGTTLTESGDYTTSFQNQFGCDSTLNLTLTVQPVANTNQQVQICAGNSYNFQGDQLTDAGVYSAVLSTAQGCDSTIQLTLSVVAVIETDIQGAICEGGTYIFGGNTLTAAGLYLDTLNSTGGCDSIVSLTLSYLDRDEINTAVSICAGASYDFDGQTLTNSGQYTATFQNQAGCDSVVTLDLMVMPVITTPLNIQICAGDSYAFDGTNYNTSGQYTATLQSQAGCDSMVVLNLSVVNTIENTLDATICEGLTLPFGGVDLSAAGTYTDTLSSQGGCDSIVTLVLVVSAQIEQTETVTICEGMTLPFGGVDLMTAGIYKDTLSAQGGCDSIVTLILEVNAPIEQTETVTICEGESYAFNGQFLTAEGQYTATDPSADGCDSITILTLAVAPTFDEAETVSLCDSVYTWPVDNNTYDQSGLYEAIFLNQNGCDSLHQLILALNPSSEWRDTVEADRQYLWPANNTAYAQSGTYVHSLKNAAGCDSVHILHLTIIPESSVYIPTAFSPNNDGINDQFTIYGDASLILIESLQIFDRWGNFLADLRDLPPSDPQYGWDGKGKGVIMDPGVYVYVARLRFEGDETALFSGDVTLTK
jgi:gliding motility-associated-like protein